MDSSESSRSPSKGHFGTTLKTAITDKGFVRQESTEDDFLSFQRELSVLIEEKVKKARLCRMVSSECSELQHDEFIALKAIFEDDLSLVDDDSKCFKIRLTDKSFGYEDDEVLDLWFSIPADYPNIPPLFELEGHGALSCERADEVYNLLLETALSMTPSTMLYDLIIIAKEYMSNIVVKRRQIRAKEEEARDKPEGESSEAEEEVMDEISIGGWSGSDYDSKAYYQPSKFIGPLHNFLERVPKYLQVENILRHDLAKRFIEQEDLLKEKYFHNVRRNPKAYGLKHILGFHGTCQGNIPNIVRTGLVVPGQGNSVTVAHGSTHGLGIYLSPDPSYSYGYCDNGGTVLVCSVLLGHVYKGDQMPLSGCERFDSLIISSGMEMVIFNPAQVLPCYLIRLVRRGDHVEDPVRNAPPPPPVLPYFDEDEKRRQERLERRARKFLPYGFGPRTALGPKMIVLDAADSDDDEEDYGDYQTYRNDFT